MAITFASNHFSRFARGEAVSASPQGESAEKELCDIAIEGAALDVADRDITLGGRERRHEPHQTQDRNGNGKLLLHERTLYGFSGP